jgi:hypothetical protein
LFLVINLITRGFPNPGRAGTSNIAARLIRAKDDIFGKDVILCLLGIPLHLVSWLPRARVINIMNIKNKKNMSSETTEFRVISV